MQNPFKSRPVITAQKPAEQQVVPPKKEIDYKSHFMFLLVLIRKTGLRFHPNDQAKLDRIIEELESGE